MSYLGEILNCRESAFIYKSLGVETWTKVKSWGSGLKIGTIFFSRKMQRNEILLRIHAATRPYLFPLKHPSFDFFPIFLLFRTSFLPPFLLSVHFFTKIFLCLFAFENSCSRFFVWGGGVLNFLFRFLFASVSVFPARFSSPVFQLDDTSEDRTAK